MVVSIYYLLLVELVLVSILDLKTKKISNNWSIFNILLFIIAAIFYSNIYPVNVGQFTLPISLLLIGFLLFLLGIMGGGDAKFLSSFYLITPIIFREKAIEYLIYSTIVVAFILFAYNLFKKYKIVVAGINMKDLKMIISCFGQRFPYAPVILLSWIWMGIKSEIF